MEIGVLVRNLAVGCIACSVADMLYLVRLMRQVTSVGIFEEVSLSKWAHNRLSVVMSEHVGFTARYFMVTS